MKLTQSRSRVAVAVAGEEAATAVRPRDPVHDRRPSKCPPDAAIVSPGSSASTSSYHSIRGEGRSTQAPSARGSRTGASSSSAQSTQAA